MPVIQSLVGRHSGEKFFLGAPKASFQAFSCNFSSPHSQSLCMRCLIRQRGIKVSHEPWRLKILFPNKVILTDSKAKIRTWT